MFEESAAVNGIPGGMETATFAKQNMKRHFPEGDFEEENIFNEEFITTG